MIMYRNTFGHICRAVWVKSKRFVIDDPKYIHSVQPSLTKRTIFRYYFYA